MLNQPFPIEITSDAFEQLRKLKERKGLATSLIRIGVKGGGCSGLEYVLRLDDTERADDLVGGDASLRVVCDPKSAKFLAGSKLVWTGNLLTGGFKFENPNAERSCGCGTSFTPKRV